MDYISEANKFMYDDDFINEDADVSSEASKLLKRFNYAKVEKFLKPLFKDGEVMHGLTDEYKNDRVLNDLLDKYASERSFVYYREAKNTWKEAMGQVFSGDKYFSDTAKKLERSGAVRLLAYYAEESINKESLEKLAKHYKTKANFFRGSDNQMWMKMPDGMSLNVSIDNRRQILTIDSQVRR